MFVIVRRSWLTSFLAFSFFFELSCDFKLAFFLFLDIGDCQGKKGLPWNSAVCFHMLFFLQNKVWLGLSLEEVKIRYRVFLLYLSCSSLGKNQAETNTAQLHGFEKIFCWFRFLFYPGFKFAPEFEKKCTFLS